MKKIAIIGTENSHASAFATLLQGNESFKITGAFGTDSEANDRFYEKFAIDCSAPSPDAFVGQVDGVMVTSRKGSTHFESVLPYLTSGMTVFIDKPITVSVNEAMKLVELSEKNGVKLCGGSCLKYAEPLLRMRRSVGTTDETVSSASFCAPLDIESPHDGFFFYAQHLVEMCLTVFGNRVKSVYAIRNADKVTAILNYGDFSATLAFGGNIYTASVTFQNVEKHTTVNNVVKLYANELSYFLSLLNGGKMKYSCSDVVYPVIILNAIYDSFTQKREIEIECI